MERAQSNALSYTFQAFTLSITVPILMYFTLSFMNKFCVHDQMPLIMPLNKQKIEGQKTEPALVRVGLSIKDFMEFDTVNNKFTILAIIWFMFDPKQIPLEYIENFSFERGQIESKSKPYTYSYDGKQIAQYEIRMSFKTNLYYGYFPFEDHKIFIVLENINASLNDLVYHSANNDFIVNTETYISGWTYHGQNVFEGYGSTKLSTKDEIKSTVHPRIIFEIDYFHYSLRYIYLLILPLLLIYVIGLFSLCVEEKYKADLINISVANIGALFAYRFILQTIAPNVAYLTISDYIFFLFLSVSFVIFLASGIIPHISLFQKKVISLSLQLYTIIAFIYIFKFWAVCT